MKRTIWSVSLIWIALIGASFTWNFLDGRAEQRRIAFEAARSFFDQVVISRAWNAGHGGVYVPVTDFSQPNPYLDVPRREIQVNDGLTLTMINPAYMTRQVSELASERHGIQFHITSLLPIRPANRPTALEAQALLSFEQGKQEVGEILSDQEHESFFYMAPLITDKACLKCHQEQG